MESSELVDTAKNKQMNCDLMHPKDSLFISKSQVYFLFKIKRSN